MLRLGTGSMGRVCMYEQFEGVDEVLGICDFRMRVWYWDLGLHSTFLLEPSQNSTDPKKCSPRRA